MTIKHKCLLFGLSYMTIHDKKSRHVSEQYNIQAQPSEICNLDKTAGHYTILNLLSIKHVALCPEKPY